jgi:hypothetical protein
MPSPGPAVHPELPRDATRRTTRALVRYKPCKQTPCQLSALAGEDFWQATLDNLSTTGAGLILNEVLDVGSFVFVEVSNAARIYARTLLARIIHITPIVDKSLLVGVEFTSELTEEELRLLLA